MKYTSILLLISIVILSFSCKKTDSVLNKEAKLLSLSSIYGNGVIDSILHKVTLKIPDSADITKLKVNIELSNNATIYPPSSVALDFTNPVTFTITSEDKSIQYIFTVSVIKPAVNFTVYDCSNWTPENNRVLQPNAIIKIYTSPQDIGTTKTFDILTTGQSGQAILYGSKSNNYYFTVEKGTSSNIINGYVLRGRYNTQAEVDASVDTAARIGGFRFADINGDGRLSSLDKLSYEIIFSDNELIGTGILQKEVYIADSN